MSTMTRPYCINTRSDRERQQRTLGALDIDSQEIIAEYGHAYCELYEWDVPEELNVPPTWIEECIYWTGTIGLGESKKGIPCFIAGNAEKRDIYGNAITWLPARNRSTNQPFNDLKAKFKGDTNPLLRMPYIPAYIVSEYAKIQYSAMLSMGQNTVAMRQPFVFRGQSGSIGVTLATNAIEKGLTWMPVVSEDGGGQEIEVLDLGATNFLDPLTGAVDATDGWICQLLGVDAVGTQKASGITTEEASSGDKRIKARRENGLKLRQSFCDKISVAHPDLHVAVKICDYYLDETPYEIPYEEENGDITNEEE